MWPGTDETLRRAVLARLDLLDRMAGQADATVLLPLARTELHRLADGWRLLLRTHRQDEDGRCSTCRAGLRAGRWPCPVWRSAHEQLIGEGIPHRERTRPLRHPFRLTTR
jgi:hypothetical protein